VRTPPGATTTTTRMYPVVFALPCSPFCLSSVILAVWLLRLPQMTVNQVQGMVMEVEMEVVLVVHVQVHSPESVRTPTGMVPKYLTFVMMPYHCRPLQPLQRAVDEEQLAMWKVQNGISYRSITSSSFQRFVQSPPSDFRCSSCICNLLPCHLPLPIRVPCRITLQKRLKPVFDRTLGDVRKNIAASPFIVLCADGWTDVTHGEFLGVTAIPLLTERVPFLLFFLAGRCQCQLGSCRGVVLFDFIAAAFCFINCSPSPTFCSSRLRT
jgi:hypothetical protein